MCADTHNENSLKISTIEVEAFIIKTDYDKSLVFGEIKAPRRLLILPSTTDIDR